jgi:homocysteine S-methyltransferase
MNANLFDPFLTRTGVVILDGALATELEEHGADLNHPLWSAKLLIENPNLIKQVHLDYLKAGADVITTASYQANFNGFEKLGYSREKCSEVLKLATALAIEARDEAKKLKYINRPIPLIAASIGPYGASLADGSEYQGNYGLGVEELMGFHRDRMKVLAESNADLLAFETIPCPEEARALIYLLKEFPGIRAWLSFSCRNEEEVSDGTNFSACAALANQSDQVVAVGVNCTDPRFVENLVKKAKQVSNKLILAYPNNGDTWDVQSRCWIPGETPSDFILEAKSWHNAGASLLGGCCRSTPHDIKKMRNILCAH